MKLPARLVPTGAVFLLASACAGGAPPGTLPPPPPASGSYLPIPESVRTAAPWQRPPAPEANASFLAIDGVSYYRLGPGDELELTIGIGETERSYPVRISEGGEIGLPAGLASGRVRIGGLALPQAEARLIEALGRSVRDPQVRLRVMIYRSSPVTLLGEVTTRSTVGESGPGIYALEGATTLLEFVFRHAAFTDHSDLTAVLITDASGRTGMFDLSAVLYRGEGVQNPLLDRGDVVTVPSLLSTRRYVYVLGEVTTPGLLRPQPGMTVVDAVALSGGPNTRARQGWVTVARGRGEDAQLFRVPYARILRKGELTANMVLQPGDIVYVSRSSMDTVGTFFRDIWGILQTGVVFTFFVNQVNP
jgi:polysaccharide export outer membrane protein